MNLRQLQCFLAIAETLHFGRAAQRLDMLPASLGRHIKMLEEDLGARLIARTTRNVALTEAGSLLVDDARDLVARFEAVQSKFRQHGRARSTVLRVGAIDSVAAGLMPQLLPHFRQEHPDISVELLEQKTIRLLPRLLSGRLDLAFVRPPEVRDPRLEFRSLFSETAVVALHAEHRLADRATIAIEQIADEPLIVPDRRSRPHSHDLAIQLFLQSGLTAHIGQIADEKQTIVNLVSTGLGLAIVPRWTARLAVAGVRFIPLENPAAPATNRLALSVAWMRGVRDPLRDRLLETLDLHLDAYAATA